nr:helix-turn-helix domain-containing protein [Solirubrobacterales bacterium]
GAIFTYIDAISAESAAAYVEAQSRAAGERARRRRALARALADPSSTADEIEALAAGAAWELPTRIAALVVSGEADPVRLASRLGGHVLAVGEEAEITAWVPDPDAPGRRAQLAAGIDAQPAVLGPTVPLAASVESLRRARVASGVRNDGHLPASGLLVADEHLLALVLHGAGAPEVRELAGQLLAPLETLGPGARKRSLATLRAWLDQPGQIQRIGGVLGVHPQTVRYRLAGLRELFGPEALDDPAQRFALSVAVRAHG